MTQEESPHRVNRRQLDLLLAHLIREPRVFLQARQRLLDEDFDDDELGHRLIWQASRDYHDRHKEMIQCQQLYVELERRMTGMPECTDVQVQQSIYDLAHKCFSAYGLVPEHALDILQDFLKQRRVRTHLLEAAERERRDVDQVVDELVDRRRQATITVADPIQPFKKGRALLGVPPRQPTGVMFVDDLLGGGTRPGEAYGFLAPTGGGKTTLINQIGTEVARRKHVFVIFHYEQRLSGGTEDEPQNDFWMGPYAYALDMLKERVEKLKSPKDFTPEEMAKYEKVTEDIGEYLYFYDFSGAKDTAGEGGVPEIDSYLMDLKAKGIKVSGFAIDWFWLMMMRSMNLKESQRENAERRYAQAMLDQIKKVGERHGCWAWINHQLQAAKGSQTRHGVKWNEAAELKSFAWTLDCCFGLNGFDGKGHARLEISKGRNQKLNGTFVQLLGEKATFIGKGEDMTWDARRKEHVSKGKENVVPVEGRTGGPVADYSGEDPLIENT